MSSERRRRGKRNAGARAAELEAEESRSRSENENENEQANEDAKRQKTKKRTKKKKKKSPLARVGAAASSRSSDVKRASEHVEQVSERLARYLCDRCLWVAPQSRPAPKVQALPMQQLLASNEWANDGDDSDAAQVRRR